MTARPVKYCFKYLFAIFHDHLLTKQLFSSFKLKFSDSNSKIFFVRHFCPTLLNKVNNERLFLVSVKATNKK